MEKNRNHKQALASAFGICLAITIWFFVEVGADFSEAITQGGILSECGVDVQC